MSTALATPSRPAIRVGRRHLSPDLAVGAVLAAGLISIAFVTAGGDDLASNTWTEMVLTAIGAMLAIAVLVAGRRERAWGGLTVALFAALAALTAASIAWSVQPASSWVEANRTVSYLAVYGGGAALARLAPRRWPALVGAIAVVASVISAYALLVKVFPATLDANDPFGRLRAPFDYWNATGLIAALGLAPCLWAGARVERGRTLRALAVPGISILLTVIVLSYSRGAVLVGVVGLASWFVYVPLRLRGALVLSLGGAGAAVLSAFALSTHGLTHDQVPIAARTTAGHTFGIVLLLTLALCTLAGFIAAFAMDRVVIAQPIRRSIGIALLIAVAALPLSGVVALAASSRGLTGEVSHIFSTLTNTNSGASNSPTRLIKLGNSRGRYWSEGLKVGQHALLKGSGALGYATAVTRYTTDTRIVPHAHSFVIQTFADFGLIGVAVMVALLAAWIVATRRTLARPASGSRDAGSAAIGRSCTSPSGSSDSAAERAGLLTLLAVVITFGVHSAIDWTWFVPGTALPALLCAGWLAGRGPLEGPSPPTWRRRPPTSSPGAAAAAVGIVAVALVCVWAIWQPLRASDATAAAVSAFGRGDTNSAIADATHAAAEDPVSVDPLFQLAAIYTATRETRAARTELLRAVARQPENPQTWLMLGEFDLGERHPRVALRSLERARQLNLGSAEIAQQIARAEAQRR